MVRLRHPAIVRLRDLRQDDSFYYVFLDLCAESDLFTFIAEHKALTEHDAKCIFKQILEALSCMHSHDIVHRDLKPENILMESSRQRRIKLADFGLSKCIPSQTLTSTSVGSPLYAAPEILSSNRYDPRKSDLWGCGVLLYVMVSGSLPWTGPLMRDVYPQIRKGEYQTPIWLSDPCRDLIHRLMCVDFEQRATLQDALAHPWMADAKVPSLYEVGQPNDDVTMHDIDLFFGIEEKEAKPVPPKQVTQSMVELPLLTADRIARKADGIEQSGPVRIPKERTLRMRRTMQIPGVTRILNPRTGRRG
jgi:serine/threonine protein kinase